MPRCSVNDPFVLCSFESAASKRPATAAVAGPAAAHGGPSARAARARLPASFMVPHPSDSESVVVTTQDVGVHVVNITTQHSTHSWSVKPGRTFTCATKLITSPLASSPSALSGPPPPRTDQDMMDATPLAAGASSHPAESDLLVGGLVGSTDPDDDGKAAGSGAVLAWTESCREVEAGSRRAIHAPALFVHPLDSGRPNYHVITVHADSSVSVFSVARPTSTSSSGAPVTRLVARHAGSGSGSQSAPILAHPWRSVGVLVLTAAGDSGPKALDPVLCGYAFDASSSAVAEIFRIPIESTSSRASGSRIVSAAYEETESLLAVVWSDGLWEGFKLHRVDSLDSEWRLEIQFARKLKNLLLRPFTPVAASSVPKEGKKRKSSGASAGSNGPTTVLAEDPSAAVPFSMCFVDPSHICMFGLRQQVSDPFASAPTQAIPKLGRMRPVLLLWELRYFTIQAENEGLAMEDVPLGCRPEMLVLPRSPFDFSVLCAVQSTVHAFNVQVVPPTVGSTLKAAEMTLRYLQKATSHMVLTMAPAPLDKPLSRWVEEVASHQARDRELLTLLESAVASGSSEEIHKAATSVLEKLSDEDLGEVGDKGRTPLLSTHMVARMVDLCLSTGKGTEAVCMLLKRGAVSLASHTNLRAEALLKRGDLSLLEHVLRYARDISEADLAKILKWILDAAQAARLESYVRDKESSHSLLPAVSSASGATGSAPAYPGGNAMVTSSPGTPAGKKPKRKKRNGKDGDAGKSKKVEVDFAEAGTEILMRAIAEMEAEEDSGMGIVPRVRMGDDTGVEYFLAAIAAVPSDQAFLTHHLQFLTFSQAMAMLHFIRKWMLRHAHFSESRLKTLFSSPVPSFLQTVTLATSLLDAHFASFALSEEAVHVVRYVGDGVREHVLGLESIAELEACLWWVGKASSGTAEEERDAGGAAEQVLASADAVGANATQDKPEGGAAEGKDGKKDDKTQAKATGWRFAEREADEEREAYFAQMLHF